MADVDKMKRVLETVLGRPITEGNQVEILRNGHQIFPSMLEAIGHAERSIDFLTFIYWTGDIGRIFAEALAERAQAGVRVRVLLDALGAWRLDTEIPEIMSNAGCDVRWFRPVDKDDALNANNRTHRKVMVVDEHVGFTGGVGIADEWDGDARDETEWRDTHFRVVGPAVDGLRASFLDNWAETGTDLIDYDIDCFEPQSRDGDLHVQVVLGMAEAGNSDVWNLFRVLIDCADHELRIATAYFTPDDEIMDRLCRAAERGVRVQIMVPGPHADKRLVQVASEKEYARLLGCGVELHSFQPSMLHAKILLIDGIMAVVGSANFNKRSIAFDDEVVLVVFDDGFTAELGRDYDADLERCVTLDPERWEDRGALQRLQERLADKIDGWF